MGRCASPYDRGVLNRRLASLLAAVTVAGLAATGCSEQSAAIRVDDTTVSRGDFEDELDFFYANDDVRTFVFGQISQDELQGELRDSYTQEFVAAVAGLRVQFIVARDVFDDEGLELADEERARAEELIAAQVPEGVDAIPRDRRSAFVDDVATFTTLQAELGEEGFGAAMTEAFRAADITVRTQYGSWDPDQLAVVPPPGPASPGGQGAASAGSIPG